MPKKLALACLLMLVSVAPRAAGPTITLDLRTSAGKVSPLFAGLMTEEITGVTSPYTVPANGLVVLTLRQQ